MIVNPAYIYMGKSAAANPVIFEQNVVNYPYSGTNYEISATGYFEMSGKSELIFSDLDLTNFTELSVPGNHSFSRTLRMSVAFIDELGNISQSVEQRYQPSSTTTNVWTIPQQFRTKKCKVKFVTNNSSSLTLRSATLS